MIEDYRYCRVRRPKAEKLTHAETASASKLLIKAGLMMYSFKQRAHYLILSQATGKVIAGPLDTAAMREYVSQLPDRETGESTPCPAPSDEQPTIAERERIRIALDRQRAFFFKLHGQNRYYVARRETDEVIAGPMTLAELRKYMAPIYEGLEPLRGRTLHPRKRPPASFHHHDDVLRQHGLRAVKIGLEPRCNIYRVGGYEYVAGPLTLKEFEDFIQNLE